jgi:hypothetical protein
MPSASLAGVHRDAASYDTETVRSRGRVSRKARLIPLPVTPRNAAGERRIDIAELERVFGVKLDRSHATMGPNSASPGNVAASMQSNGMHGPDSERIIAAQAETIAQQDATIRHLRDLVDREAEERRRVQAQLTGLLTTTSSDDPTKSPWPRRPWWRRWFR